MVDFILVSLFRVFGSDLWIIFLKRTRNHVGRGRDTGPVAVFRIEALIMSYRLVIILIEAVRQIA